MTELKEKITELNDRFGKTDPGEILAFLASTFPGKVIFSTSFGAEDQVITEMLHKITPPVSIFTLDTGRLFPETYDLLSVTSSKYQMDIRILFPDFVQVEEMVSNNGVNLFYESVEKRKLCCRIRKVIPLSRALRGKEFWVSGLRKEQSAGRSEISLFEWDEDHRLIKVHPLADWSADRTWRYIREHKIPYNPLHDKGFPSIGCQPCTRAVLPGEDSRAGRWWWESADKKECGIHQHKKE